MKKYNLLISTLLCVTLLAACSEIKNSSEIDTEKSSSKSTVNDANSSTNPFTDIKITDIEWITKKGGLPSDKNWVVLFPQKDSDKISKIINLINSSSQIGKSTEEDMDFLRRKHGYPVDIVIRVKDGSEYSLKSAMKLTTRQTANGTETTGTTYKDRFILTYDKNGTTEYYTAFSNDVAEYILDAHNPDFPKVDGFSITPETLTPGDKIIVSGDGTNCQKSGA